MTTPMIASINVRSPFNPPETDSPLSLSVWQVPAGTGEPLLQRLHLGPAVDGRLARLDVRGTNRRGESVAGALDHRDRRRVAEMEPIGPVQSPLRIAPLSHSPSTVPSKRVHCLGI